MNVQIRIELEDGGGPTLEGLEFKHHITDAIEACRIGTVTGSGIGFGAIDIDVELADSDCGVTRLRKLLQVLEVENAEISAD